VEVEEVANSETYGERVATKATLPDLNLTAGKLFNEPVKTLVNLLKG